MADVLTKQWENPSRQKVGSACVNALRLERTSNISDIRESTRLQGWNSQKRQESGRDMVDIRHALW